jgi:hypothetical protein
MGLFAKRYPEETWAICKLVRSQGSTPLHFHDFLFASAPLSLRNIGLLLTCIAMISLHSTFSAMICIRSTFIHSGFPFTFLSFDFRFTLFDYNIPFTLTGSHSSFTFIDSGFALFLPLIINSA